MGNVRPYDPTPVDPPNDVKLGDFSFKLVSVEIGDLKKRASTRSTRSSCQLRFVPATVTMSFLEVTGENF